MRVLCVTMGGQRQAVIQDQFDALNVNGEIHVQLEFSAGVDASCLSTSEAILEGAGDVLAEFGWTAGSPAVKELVRLVARCDLGERRVLACSLAHFRAMARMARGGSQQKRDPGLAAEVGTASVNSETGLTLPVHLIIEDNVRAMKASFGVEIASFFAAVTRYRTVATVSGTASDPESGSSTGTTNGFTRDHTSAGTSGYNSERKEESGEEGDSGPPALWYAGYLGREADLRETHLQQTHLQQQGCASLVGNSNSSSSSSSSSSSDSRGEDSSKGDTMATRGGTNNSIIVNNNDASDDAYDDAEIVQPFPPGNVPLWGCYGYGVSTKGWEVVRRDISAAGPKALFEAKRKKTTAAATVTAAAAVATTTTAAATGVANSFSYSPSSPSSSPVESSSSPSFLSGCNAVVLPVDRLLPRKVRAAGLSIVRAARPFLFRMPPPHPTCGDGQQQGTPVTNEGGTGGSDGGRRETPAVVVGCLRSSIHPEMDFRFFAATTLQLRLTGRREGWEDVWLSAAERLAVACFEADRVAKVRQVPGASRLLLFGGGGTPSPLVQSSAAAPSAAGACSQYVTPASTVTTGTEEAATLAPAATQKSAKEALAKAIGRQSTATLPRSRVPAIINTSESDSGSGSRLLAEIDDNGHPVAAAAAKERERLERTLDDRLEAVPIAEAVATVLKYLFEVGDCLGRSFEPLRCGEKVCAAAAAAAAVDGVCDDATDGHLLLLHTAHWLHAARQRLVAAAAARPAGSEHGSSHGSDGLVGGAGSRGGGYDDDDGAASHKALQTASVVERGLWFLFRLLARAGYSASADWVLTCCLTQPPHAPSPPLSAGAVPCEYEVERGALRTQLASTPQDSKHWRNALAALNRLDDGKPKQGHILSHDGNSTATSTTSSTPVLSVSSSSSSSSSPSLSSSPDDCSQVGVESVGRVRLRDSVVTSFITAIAAANFEEVDVVSLSDDLRKHCQERRQESHEQKRGHTKQERTQDQQQQQQQQQRQFRELVGLGRGVLTRCDLDTALVALIQLRHEHQEAGREARRGVALYGKKGGHDDDDINSDNNVNDDGGIMGSSSRRAGNGSAARGDSESSNYSTRGVKAKRGKGYGDDNDLTVRSALFDWFVGFSALASGGGRAISLMIDDGDDYVSRVASALSENARHRHHHHHHHLSPDAKTWCMAIQCLCALRRPRDALWLLKLVAPTAFHVFSHHQQHRTRHSPSLVAPTATPAASATVTATRGDDETDAVCSDGVDEDSGVDGVVCCYDEEDGGGGGDSWHGDMSDALRVLLVGASACGDATASQWALDKLLGRRHRKLERTVADDELSVLPPSSIPSLRAVLVPLRVSRAVMKHIGQCSPQMVCWKDADDNNDDGDHREAADNDNDGRGFVQNQQERGLLQVAWELIDLATHGGRGSDVGDSSGADSDRSSSSNGDSSGDNKGDNKADMLVVAQQATRDSTAMALASGLSLVQILLEAAVRSGNTRVCASAVQWGRALSGEDEGQTTKTRHHSSGSSSQNHRALCSPPAPAALSPALSPASDAIPPSVVPPPLPTSRTPDFVDAGGSYCGSNSSRYSVWIQRRVGEAAAVLSACVERHEHWNAADEEVRLAVLAPPLPRTTKQQKQTQNDVVVAGALQGVLPSVCARLLARDCFSPHHGMRRGSGGGAKLIGKRLKWLRKVVATTAAASSASAAATSAAAALATTSSASASSSFDSSAFLCNLLGCAGGGDDKSSLTTAGILEHFHSVSESLPETSPSPLSSSSSLPLSLLQHAVPPAGYQYEFGVLSAALHWSTRYSEVRRPRDLDQLQDEIASALSLYFLRSPRGGDAVGGSCDVGSDESSIGSSGHTGVATSGNGCNVPNKNGGDDEQAAWLLAVVGAVVACELLSPQSSRKLLNLALDALARAVGCGENGFAHHLENSSSGLKRQGVGITACAIDGNNTATAGSSSSTCIIDACARDLSPCKYDTATTTTTTTTTTAAAAAAAASVRRCAMSFVITSLRWHRSGRRPSVSSLPPGSSRSRETHQSRFFRGDSGESCWVSQPTPSPDGAGAFGDNSLPLSHLSLLISTFKLDTEMHRDDNDDDDDSGGGGKGEFDDTRQGNDDDLSFCGVGKDAATAAGVTMARSTAGAAAATRRESAPPPLPPPPREAAVAKTSAVMSDDCEWQVVRKELAASVVQLLVGCAQNAASDTNADAATAEHGVRSNGKESKVVSAPAASASAAAAHREPTVDEDKDSSAEDSYVEKHAKIILDDGPTPDRPSISPPHPDGSSAHGWCYALFANHRGWLPAAVGPGPVLTAALASFVHSAGKKENKHRAKNISATRIVGTATTTICSDAGSDIREISDTRSSSGGDGDGGGSDMAATAGGSDRDDGGCGCYLYGSIGHPAADESLCGRMGQFFNPHPFIIFVEGDQDKRAQLIAWVNNDNTKQKRAATEEHDVSEVTSVLSTAEGALFFLFPANERVRKEARAALSEIAQHPLGCSANPKKKKRRARR